MISFWRAAGESAGVCTTMSGLKSRLATSGQGNNRGYWIKRSERILTGVFITGKGNAKCPARQKELSAKRYKFVCLPVSFNPDFPPKEDSCHLFVEKQRQTVTNSAFFRFLFLHCPGVVCRKNNTHTIVVTICNRATSRKHAD